MTEDQVIKDVDAKRQGWWDSGRTLGALCFFYNLAAYGAMTLFGNPEHPYHAFVLAPLGLLMALATAAILIVSASSKVRDRMITKRLEKANADTDTSD